MGFLENATNEIKEGMITAAVGGAASAIASGASDEMPGSGVILGIAAMGATVGSVAVNGVAGSGFINGAVNGAVLGHIQDAIEEVNASDEGKDLLNSLKELGEKVDMTLAKDLEDSYEDIVDSAEFVGEMAAKDIEECEPSPAVEEKYADNNGHDYDDQQASPEYY